jgi:ADP-ribose pyrophosphatase YjhB (NUDIX family)
MDCKDHSLIVHVAVLHHSSALLLKYRDSSLRDNQTGWFLPNDSLKHTEHPEVGARRVLKEHAGIDNASLKLVQIESFVGDNGSWHLIFDYIAIPNSNHIMKGKEISSAEWFRLDQLPEAKEFAHDGWGRSILVKLTSDIPIPK